MQLADRVGVRAAEELARIAQQLISVVSQGTNPGVGAAINSDQQLLQLITDMETAIAELQNGGQAIFRAAYKQNGNLILSRMPEIHAALGQQASPTALRSARAAFISQARKDFKPLMASWADSFQKSGEVLKSGMQRTLVEGQLNGWNQRQVAESFLKIPEFQFSNLPKLGAKGERIFTMGGKLSPSDALIRRAHVIARTEMNAVHNRSITTHAEAHGFELFRNVNMDPVSDQCIAANAAGAMTLAEWEAGLGRPPRHPNCDSTLSPVPNDFDEDEILEGIDQTGETTNTNPHLPG